MGYKVFTAGEEALASDVNTLLMSQTVARFANAGARTAAGTGITAPVLNQLSVLDSRPGIVQYWNGSAWVDQGAAELFYNEVTASVAISNTTAATSHLVAGGGAWTFDGSPILVEFYAPQAQTGNAGAGASLMIQLYDGTTDLGFWGQFISPAAGVLCTPINLRRRLVPTVGVHSYKVGAWVPTGGPGNIGMGLGGAGQLAPGLFRVSRCA
jgi:hypothetical protein